MVVTAGAAGRVGKLLKRKRLKVARELALKPE
jgi:hypothetical protein